MSAEAPRVGFVGVGWIGRARLQTLADSGRARIAAICDPSPEARERALQAAPSARAFERYEDMLGIELDGIVIATPSALHARQCIAAFEHGAAVFCQKPLARSESETRSVLQAAERADRLLRVDFCYRETLALSRMRELVRSGELGTPFAAELLFHNAYGPDKSWARDAELAGGGCLMDLGVHLLDALLWIFDYPAVASADVKLFEHGSPLDRRNTRAVEDFAVGSFALQGGPAATLACSWGAAVGEPARIRIQVHATKGGIAFENVDGSFYDFRCDRYGGTSRTSLVAPPDEWGGKAILSWAAALAESPRHRPTPDLAAVARGLDVLYGRVGPSRDAALRSP